MVLDTARPRYKENTKKPGMRGRDAARKSTPKVNILQVFTIDFSEIQFVVNHNSQSDGQKCKEMDELKKKTLCTISLQRNLKSNFEQVRQKWAYETSIRFSSCCLSLKNRIHRESGEQVAEPTSPQQYRRWHLSSSASWWDKSEWNWWSS